MSTASQRSLVLGFLHVRQSRPETFRGGYLLVTDYGRPIEFHYTSEIHVPKLHQHLYGPQFEPTLFVETFAKPLTDRQSTAPRMIAVDQRALLGLRSRIPAPVVMITGSAPQAEGDSSRPVQVDCMADFEKDLAAFEKIRSLVPPAFDWIEPFERIDAALAEIQTPSLGLVG